jgi:hypothetical protein
LSASWQQLVDSVSGATQSLVVKEKTTEEQKE